MSTINSKSTKAHGRLNSLGIAERDLGKALDSLDAMSGGASNGSIHRTHLRWPFRIISVEVELTHPGGGRVRIKMVCRNISSGGVGLLHNAFVHVGSPCRVFLPHPERRNDAIEGTVARCRHVAGVIHDLGVKFSKPIHVRDYIRPDAFTQFFSMEKVDPEKLTGCILYVEDNPMEQMIVRHYLRHTQLRVRTASTCEEARKLAGEGCDLILSDYHLPDGNGAALAEQLRTANINTPVVVTSADVSSNTRETLNQAGIEMFLQKPLRDEVLIRAIAEHLLVGAANPNAVNASKDPANAHLYQIFAEELVNYRAKLKKCIDDDDAMACYMQCQQIGGTASCLGFDGLAVLANKAAAAVAASMSVVESSSVIGELITACERAHTQMGA